MSPEKRRAAYRKAVILTGMQEKCWKLLEKQRNRAKGFDAKNMFKKASKSPDYAVKKMEDMGFIRPKRMQDGRILHRRTNRLPDVTCKECANVQATPRAGDGRNVYRCGAMGWQEVRTDHTCNLAERADAQEKDIMQWM